MPRIEQHFAIEPLALASTCEMYQFSTSANVQPSGKAASDLSDGAWAFGQVIAVKSSTSTVEPSEMITARSIIP